MHLLKNRSINTTSENLNSSSSRFTEFRSKAQRLSFPLCFARAMPRWDFLEGMFFAGVCLMHGAALCSWIPPSEKQYVPLGAGSVSVLMSFRRKPESIFLAMDARFRGHDTYLWV
jgi:hypothetical protein